MLRVAAVPALVLTALVLLLGAPDAQAGPRSSGGPIVTKATEAPYTVYVDLTSASCSGEILDATHILLAAHCVFTDPPDNKPLSASDMTVYAGAVTLPDDNAQARKVSSYRVYPGYRPGYAGIDIAELVLSQALDLGPTVKPVAVAPVGASPAPGTALRLYGWGESSPGKVDNHLHSLDVKAEPSYVCAGGVGGELCATSAIGQACHGDSGGPLVSTAGAPTLYGVFDFGDLTCDHGNADDGYADVTLPGLARWIAGASDVASPPYVQDAGKFGSYDAVTGLENFHFSTPAGAPNVIQAGLPAFCDAALWVGAASEQPRWIDETGRTVATGPTYTPGDADAGHQLGCVSTATNANGSSQSASGLRPVAPRIAPGLVVTVSSSGRVNVTAPFDLLSVVTLSAVDQAGRAATSPPVGTTSVSFTGAPGVYTICATTPELAQYAAGRQCGSYTRHGSASSLITRTGKLGGGTGAHHSFHLAVAPGLVGRRVTLTYRFTRTHHKARTVRRKVPLRKTLSLHAPTARSHERIALSITTDAVSVGGVPYDRGTFTVSLGHRR